MENTDEQDQEKEMQLHKAESLSRVALTLVDDLYSTGRVAVTENG